MIPTTILLKHAIPLKVNESNNSIYKGQKQKKQMKLKKKKKKSSRLES
jgi:hypothetical protein